MSTIEETVGETIRIVRTQERVAALLRPMQQMVDMIGEILADAPELEPELNEVRSRIADSCDHLRSASEVIQAKIDLL